MKRSYTVLVKGNDGFTSVFEVEAASVSDAYTQATSKMIALAQTTIEQIRIVGITETGWF